MGRSMACTDWEWPFVVFELIRIASGTQQRLSLDLDLNLERDG
jgi:hypothetical protein